MRKNRKKRQGTNLVQAPKSICKAGDIRNIGIDKNGRQILVLQDVSTGDYLRSFDPSVRMPGFPYAIGRAEFTSSRSAALQFPTLYEVLVFINQQSTASPLCPDGKPNRPLTTYTFLIVSMSSCSGRPL